MNSIETPRQGDTYELIREITLGALTFPAGSPMRVDTGGMNPVFDVRHPETGVRIRAQGDLHKDARLTHANPARGHVREIATNLHVIEGTERMEGSLDYRGNRIEVQYDPASGRMRIRGAAHRVQAIGKALADTLEDAAVLQWTGIGAWNEPSAVLIERLMRYQTPGRRAEDFAEHVRREHNALRAQIGSAA